MGSKKKKKTLFSYLNAKDRKNMWGKPKRKQLGLEWMEMNKEIIKKKRNSSLYTGSFYDD